MRWLSMLEAASVGFFFETEGTIISGDFCEQG